jgi:hypothetical protein
MTKLSEFQRRTVERIRAGGGVAYYAGGGYWDDTHGVHLTVEPLPNSASGIVSTQTIRCLERLGVLKRRSDLPHRFRPPVELVEEGTK